MAPLHPNDRSAAVGFSHNPVERLSERRDDADFVAATMRGSAARFIVLAGDVPVLKAIEGGHDPLFTHKEVASLGEPRMTIFLGVDEEGTALFSAALEPSAGQVLAERSGLELVDLRSMAMRDLVSPSLLGEIGCAKAMLDWHARHRFCANCGSVSDVRAAGWRRECPTCSTHHFPRVDPVVIMAAVRGDRCLLGRQARFAPGMYSALAGFLEPGETIENAVRREIKEEAGVPCSRVAYLASQPWPFPSSLMIGCFARAESDVVTVDHTELEDARWFSRDEVEAMLEDRHPGGLKAPAPFAIAHHLVRAFVDEGEAVLG